MEFKAIAGEFLIDMNIVDKLVTKYLTGIKTSIDNNEKLEKSSEQLNMALNRVHSAAGMLARHTALLSSKNAENLENHIFFFKDRIESMDSTVANTNELLDSNFMNFLDKMTKDRVDSMAKGLKTIMAYAPMIKESYDNQSDLIRDTVILPPDKDKIMKFMDTINDFKSHLNWEMKKMVTSDLEYFTESLYDKTVKTLSSFDSLVENNDNLHQMLLPLKSTLVSMKEAVFRSATAPSDIACLSEPEDEEIDDEFKDLFKDEFPVEDYSDTITSMKTACKEIHDTMNERMVHFNHFLDKGLTVIKETRSEANNDYTSSLSM